MHSYTSLGDKRIDETFRRRRRLWTVGFSFFSAGASIVVFRSVQVPLLSVPSLAWLQMRKPGTDQVVIANLANNLLGGMSMLHGLHLPPRMISPNTREFRLQQGTQQRGHGVASQQKRMNLPYAAQQEHLEFPCSARTGQDGTLLTCECPEIWLQPQSDHYRALHVPRPQTWEDIQKHVDALASPGFLKRSVFPLQATVQIERKSSSELAIALSAGARYLVGPLEKNSLPEQVIVQIQEDIKTIGMVLAKMLPTARELELKLELFGKTSCKRWHRDSHVARAIVSYNNCGTVYVHDDNVDPWALEHGLDNTRILHDQSKVFSVDVGDMLLMKGKRFPTHVNGLVHKSPETRYHWHGGVKNRLCMKIDVT